MVKNISFLYIILCLLFLSCQENTNPEAPVIQPNKALSSVMSFLQYREEHVRLYENFVPLDKASRVIPRELFFRYLKTGRFLPVRLRTGDSIAHYRLDKLETSVDPEIRSIIKQWGSEVYANFQLEGSELPRFDFTDVEGKRYTKASTKGKIVVVKCWFLNCLPCREEMPALNKIKAQFQNREDIVFVSLCWDPRNKVDKFLEKTAFHYAVVPDQYDLLMKDMNVDAYPTHFVINKQGKIVIKTTDYRAMQYVLNREAQQ